MPDLLRIVAVIALTVGLVAAFSAIYGASGPVDCSAASFSHQALDACERAAEAAQWAIWGAGVGYALAGIVAFLVLWAQAEIVTGQDSILRRLRAAKD